MIRRYINNVINGIPVYFSSNNGTSTGISTEQYSTSITGAPLAVITLKVTALTDNGTGGTYTVDGVPYVLNDTFTKSLDGSGNVTMTIIVNTGDDVGGHTVSATLSINATTIGVIGSPSAVNQSKAVFTNLTINNTTIAATLDFVKTISPSPFTWNYGPVTPNQTQEYGVPPGTNYTVSVKVINANATVDVNGTSRLILAGGSDAFTCDTPIIVTAS